MTSKPTAADIDHHLPVKPLVLQVLLALSEGDRHGWALVRDVQQRGGFERILPGNFYRTLRTMLDEGLIAETAGRAASGHEDDDRRRYFALTPLGHAVASAEAGRLADVVREARAKGLLARSRS